MTMGKIIFYEDMNFQGRSYETSSDCPDLTSFLSRCNSCKVESGCFMVYDRSNFMGNQYIVNRGEYSDYQHMCLSDCIRSCRVIPMHTVKISETENFGSEMHEPMDDCNNMIDNQPIVCVDKPFVLRPVICLDGPSMKNHLTMMDRYRMSDCQSCNVMDGHWLMYEQPHYRGRQMYMRPGEYRNFKEMGMNNMMRINFMRRIMD